MTEHEGYIVHKAVALQSWFQDIMRDESRRDSFEWTDCITQKTELSAVLRHNGHLQYMVQAALAELEPKRSHPQAQIESQQYMDEVVMAEFAAQGMVTPDQLAA